MSRRRTPPSRIFKVEKVQSLKRGFKDHGKAQEILERIAKEVKPLMFKHKWKVKLLAEMSPKANSNVLGVNINKSTIKIRLRVSKDGGFYPYSHHLGTMLHELAHMRYGNHSAEFYDLLKDLRNDMEKILNGRMTVPFAEAGCGIRLGGKRPRNSREIRSARLQNLENRGRYRNLIGTGSYRLGSGTTNPTTTTTTTTTTTVHKNKRRKLKRTSTPPAKRREKLVNAVMRRTKKKKTNDDIIDLTENDDSIYVIV